MDKKGYVQERKRIELLIATKMAVPFQYISKMWEGTYTFRKTFCYKLKRKTNRG